MSGKFFEDDCHAIEMAISSNSIISDDGYGWGNGLLSTLKLVQAYFSKKLKCYEDSP